MVSEVIYLRFASNTSEKEVESSSNKVESKSATLMN